MQVTPHLSPSPSTLVHPHLQYRSPTSAASGHFGSAILHQLGTASHLPHHSQWPPPDRLPPQQRSPLPQLGPCPARPAHFRHAHRVLRACARAPLPAGEDPSPAPSWAKSSFLQGSQQPLLVTRGPDLQDHVLPTPRIGSQDRNLIHADTDILILPPPDTPWRTSTSPSVGVSVFPERPPVPLSSRPGPAWPPLYDGLIQALPAGPPIFLSRPASKSFPPGEVCLLKLTLPWADGSELLLARKNDILEWISLPTSTLQFTFLHFAKKVRTGLPLGLPAVIQDESSFLRPVSRFSF